jgi:uncharacterized protein DUF6934
MNLDHYAYLMSEDFLSYHFCSEGPNGKIRKVILFTLVTMPSKSYYNLSFGDLDEEGKINDFVTSNNHDAEKVLATVARAVIVFTNNYPDAVVFAEGSTASRTRRYQMGINKFWNEIEPVFKVFGFVKSEGFKPFRSGMNYMAFAVKRKKM